MITYNDLTLTGTAQTTLPGGDFCRGPLVPFGVTKNTPRNNSATGYGSKIPTGYAAFLDGKWRRVYCISYSNSGSLYVNFKGGRVFLSITNTMADYGLPAHALDHMARGFKHAAQVLHSEGQAPEMSAKAIGYSCSIAGRFIENNTDLITEYMREVTGSTGSPEAWAALGSDLYLTANHHGAGYWDRGAGGIGQEMTEAAYKIGEISTYEHNGRLFFEF